MIEDIRAAQQELEANGQSLLATIEEKSLSEDEITNLLAWNVDAVHAAYTQLFERLLFKYADGYINTWNAGKFVSTAAGTSLRQALCEFNVSIFVFRLSYLVVRSSRLRKWPWASRHQAV